MRKADNLPPYCAVVKNSRSLNFLDPYGPAWPVTGVLYLYLGVLVCSFCVELRIGFSVDCSNYSWSNTRQMALVRVSQKLFVK